MILTPKDCALCLYFLFPEVFHILKIESPYVFISASSEQSKCFPTCVPAMAAVLTCFCYLENVIFQVIRTKSSWFSILPLRQLAIICSISIAFYWPETNFLSWINLSLSVSANWLQLSSVWVPSAYYPFSWPLIISYPLLCFIYLFSFSLCIKTTKKFIERLIKQNITLQKGK